ncbi:MAG: ResB protein required for cytochrome c biosynthesis-like protein [Moorella sp. 60_41]|nr:MAG: ResB protein required for cytochrome c biosynthesis-like protein [Moorella sp. 60_41]
MKAAFLLLLCLGAAASAGTFIPQGQPPSFYYARYGEAAGNFLLLLSLDQVYRSWWFLTLAALLGLSLLLCSLRRWKNLRGWRGRGSVLLHLSLLLILAGAVLSAYLGRSAYVEIGVGEGVDLAAHGFPGFALSVKDFRIEYYPTLEPRQYISLVRVESDSGSVREQEVKVNHPLKFEGLKIYQKRYGWLIQGEVSYGTGVFPFQAAHGGELLLDEVQRLRLRFFLLPGGEGATATPPSSPPTDTPGLACLLLRDTDILATGIIGPGESRTLGDYTVTFIGHRRYTGLEIKRDPGVGVTYAGFVLVLVGFVMRYLISDKMKLAGGES